MAHPGQRCSILCPHSPLAAHVSLPGEGKCHRVPGPAGTLGASGKQVVWGAQGAARTGGIRDPGTSSAQRRIQDLLSLWDLVASRMWGGIPDLGTLGTWDSIQHLGASRTQGGFWYPAGH